MKLGSPRVVTLASVGAFVVAAFVLVPGLTGRATGGCYPMLNSWNFGVVTTSGPIEPPSDVRWGWASESQVEVRIRCGDNVDRYQYEVCAGTAAQCRYDADGRISDPNSNYRWQVETNPSVEGVGCPHNTNGATRVATYRLSGRNWPKNMEVEHQIWRSTLPKCWRVRAVNTTDRAFSAEPRCQVDNMNDRTVPPHSLSWRWQNQTEIDFEFTCALYGNRHFIERCSGTEAQCALPGATWDVVHTSNVCPRKPEATAPRKTVRVGGFTTSSPGCFRVSTENLDNPRDGGPDDHRSDMRCVSDNRHPGYNCDHQRPIGECGWNELPHQPQSGMRCMCPGSGCWQGRCLPCTQLNQPCTQGTLCCHGSCRSGRCR